MSKLFSYIMGYRNRSHAALSALLVAGLAFSLSFWRGPVKIADILFALLATLTFMDHDSRKKFFGYASIRNNYVRYALAFAVFLGVGQISTYITRGIAPNTAVFANYARIGIDFGFFFLMAFLVAHKQELLSYATYAIVLSPILVLSLLRNPGHIDPSLLSGGRATGYLQNPLLFGSWMSLVFLLGLAHFLRAKKIAPRLLIGAWLVFAAYLILWSAPRAAWLSLGIAFLIWCAGYLVQHERKKAVTLAFAVCTVFVLGYALLPNSPWLHMQPWVRDRIVAAVNNPFGAQIRTALWQGAVPFAAEHPLGFGPWSASGQEPRYTATIAGALQTVSTPSNTLIEITFYGGLGAVIAFLAIVFAMGRDVKKFLKISPPDELEIAWILASLALLIQMFFNDAFLFRFIWFVFGASLGMMHAKIKNLAEPLSVRNEGSSE